MFLSEYLLTDTNIDRQDEKKMKNRAAAGRKQIKQ
jgi:hypothetical protein